jgi:hypothetical protein
MKKTRKTIAILIILFISSALLINITTDNFPKTTVLGTLISNLSELINSNDWTANSSELIFEVGLQMGTKTLQDVENWAITQTGISGWKIWVFLDKYGIADKMAIEKLMDGVTIGKNGLPVNFTVTDRYLLWGYHWAEVYNYSSSVWNVTKAFLNFEWASQNNIGWNLGNSSGLCPVFFTINETDNTKQGSGTPRYYDEAAETMECFLRFYELGCGINALIDAENCWKWINAVTTPSTNNNEWSDINPKKVSDGQPYWHYGYKPDRGLYIWECESGGFTQIAMHLFCLNNSIDISNVTLDLENRYLYYLWLSPQWGGPEYNRGVVIHAYTGNDQLRLENTLMAWSSLYGLYANLADNYRTSMIEMLETPEVGGNAWQRLYGSHLWNSAPVDESKAYTCSLLMYFGIVPHTAVLAIPLSENFYEDTSNLFDYELFSMNITTRTLRVSFIVDGTVTFQYGDRPLDAAVEKGVYNIVFDSGWNSITSMTKVENLPANREYLYTGK